MNDAALLELLRAELPRLVREAVAEALAASRLAAPHARAVEALAAVYGHGVPFTSADVSDALALRLDTRQALRHTLHVALGGKAPTTERIGRLLRSIVAAGGTAGWMLTTPATESGSRVWMLQRVGD